MRDNWPRFKNYVKHSRSEQTYRWIAKGAESYAWVRRLGRATCAPGFDRRTNGRSGWLADVRL